MNRPLYFFLIVSLSLHLAVAGLWHGQPLLSAGISNATLLLSLQRPAAYKSRQARPTAEPNKSLSAPFQKETTSVALANNAEPVQVKPNRIYTGIPEITSPDKPEDAKTQPNLATTRQTATRSLSSQHDDAPEYTAQINAALQRKLAVNFVYPRLAQRRGLEGDVLLGLRLEADGQMTDIRVIRSSGHLILDRSAVRSAEHAGRAQDVIQWLAGQHLDMVLPIHFRLVDS